MLTQLSIHLKFAAAPPPAASDSAQHTYHGASTLGLSQFKFCMSTVRSLRKIKDAGPFLRPVDPVALNIPHYPSIVKNPMDFSTVERKLTASNPAKPDPNPANPRYQSAGEFIADVRMIFSNAELFNGPDHLVTAMGKRVEAVFDKQIKQLPPPDEVALRRRNYDRRVLTVFSLSLALYRRRRRLPPLRPLLSRRSRLGARLPPSRPSGARKRTPGGHGEKFMRRRPKIYPTPSPPSARNGNVKRRRTMARRSSCGSAAGSSRICTRSSCGALPLRSMNRSVRRPFGPSIVQLSS